MSYDFYLRHGPQPVTRHFRVLVDSLDEVVALFEDFAVGRDSSKDTFAWGNL